VGVRVLSRTRDLRGRVRAARQTVLDLRLLGKECQAEASAEAERQRGHSDSIFSMDLLLVRRPGAPRKHGPDDLPMHRPSVKQRVEVTWCSQELLLPACLHLSQSARCSGSS